ncbi:hypothetical protein LG3211_2535 [Lysobacter gummosus]|nr:hypothetical protein LG3211_2535 [Lysobacter gummosus]
MRGLVAPEERPRPWIETAICTGVLANSAATELSSAAAVPWKGSAS